MTKNDNILELRELIRILIRNLGVLEKQEASCCGTTIGQCHAIVEIGRAEELSLNELAALLNLDNSTTSRTVNNLVEQGMLERYEDTNDRRYLRIRLTEAGKASYTSIEERMNSYFQNIMEAIPEEKREQLIESLQLLEQAVKSKKCCW